MASGVSKVDSAATKLDSEIEHNLDLSQLRYSMVWEDAEILSEALAIQPGDTVLSITSSGDNVLRLLLDEPKKIFAADFSAVQNAVLQLKIAVIKELSREDAITVLGFTGTPQARLDLFASLKSLPPSVKAVLEDSGVEIGGGLAHCGRLERFFGTYRQQCYQPIVGKDLLKEYMYATTPASRHTAYNKWPKEEVYSKMWELSTELAVTGRSGPQFKYVGQSTEEYGRLCATRLQRMLSREASLCRPNHYLSSLLFGSDLLQDTAAKDIDCFLPAYLTSENYGRLRSLVDRIEIVTGSIESLLSDEFLFDKANLSDVFEYMSHDAAQDLFKLMAEKCSVGGRIAFWNLFVDRHPPRTGEADQKADKRFKLLGGLSSDLQLLDRFPVYKDFFVCACTHA